MLLVLLLAQRVHNHGTRGGCGGTTAEADPFCWALDLWDREVADVPLDFLPQLLRDICLLKKFTDGHSGPTFLLAEVVEAYIVMILLTARRVPGVIEEQREWSGSGFPATASDSYLLHPLEDVAGALGSIPNNCLQVLVLSLVDDLLDSGGSKADCTGRRLCLSPAPLLVVVHQCTMFSIGHSKESCDVGSAASSASCSFSIPMPPPGCR